MNYQIEFLAPASQELEEAFLWYEQKKENLGLELIEELEYYFIGYFLIKTTLIFLNY